MYGPAEAQPAANAAVAPKPPARHLRRVGLALSITAVVVSLGCGVLGRQAFHLYRVRGVYEDAFPTVLAALLVLLVALLLRMAAAICELLWLERTWTNLPLALRKVGPMDQVGSGLLVGLSLVPGVAWLWKLGVVAQIADGLERVRAHSPFRAPIPKRLGVAAVIVSWIPGLNVYLAPFLWEVFAVRVDAALSELRAVVASRP